MCFSLPSRIVNYIFYVAVTKILARFTGADIHRLGEYNSNISIGWVYFKDSRFTETVQEICNFLLGYWNLGHNTSNWKILVNRHACSWPTKERSTYHVFLFFFYLLRRQTSGSFQRSIFFNLKNEKPCIVKPDVSGFWHLKKNFHCLISPSLLIYLCRSEFTYGYYQWCDEVSCLYWFFGF